MKAKQGVRTPERSERAARTKLGFDMAAGAAHVAASDKRLAKIIVQSGPIGLELAAAKSTFEALAESIVYQQLTGKAASTIHGRLCGLFPRRRLRPEGVLATSDDALRGAGLSRAKVLALRDLSARAIDGTVPAIRELRAMADEEIVESLVKIRGIGRWSVEMLLIFRLGRPDVLPIHDYGIRTGFQLAYGKRELPSPKDVLAYGERWKPFRTAASWYLWRAVDLHRKQNAAGRTGG